MTYVTADISPIEETTLRLTKWILLKFTLDTDRRRIVGLVARGYEEGDPPTLKIAPFPSQRVLIMGPLYETLESLHDIASMTQQKLLDFMVKYFLSKPTTSFVNQILKESSDEEEV